MKKGLLAFRINKDDRSNFGVIKKCRAQCQAFRQQGIQADVLFLSKQGVLLNEDLIHPVLLPPHTFKIYLFYFFRFGKVLRSVVQKGEYDFIYLRHPFFDPLLAAALQAIKNDFPRIKIILEVNTYPYDAEPKRPLHRLSLFLDQYLRKNAKQYLDRIVDYGLQQSIWEVPTINIRNGIDVRQLPVVNYPQNKTSIKMIAVGNWSYWHGLDRLIKGLAHFYKSEQPTKVEVLIVGEGPETAKLQALVKQYNLEGYINFHPAAHGAILDKLFEDINLGVGTLGIHRKSVKLDASLKHREYCARGLPFILSTPDLDFPADLNFVHYLAISDEPINVTEIAAWYLSIDPEIDIPKYAQEHLTWKAQLQPVFEYLKL